MDWFQFYLSLVPISVFVLVALILWAARQRFPGKFLLWSGWLVLFPAMVIVGHWYSVSEEMKRRTGTYRVVQTDHEHQLCGGKNFDSLTLTLYRKGAFRFNYQPCFANKIEGTWRAVSDAPAGVYRTKLEWINDNLILDTDEDVDDKIFLTAYPPIWDSIKLKHYQPVYLVFAKSK